MEIRTLREVRDPSDFRGPLWAAEAEKDRGTRAYKFLGGPWDGRLAATDGAPHYFVAELPEPMAYSPNEVQTAEKVKFKKHIYTRSGPNAYVYEGCE